MQVMCYECTTYSRTAKKNAVLPTVIKINQATEPKKSNLLIEHRITVY